MMIRSCSNGKHWSSPEKRSAELRLCLDDDKKVVTFDLVTHGCGEYRIYNLHPYAEALRCYEIACEWVDGKTDDDLYSVLFNPKDGTDEFSLRFEKVWGIMEELPRTPGGKFWCDGENILCRNEEESDVVADFLDAIIGDSVTHTGYYDPQEDERSGEVDDHTGWYYVDFD